MFFIFHSLTSAVIGNSVRYIGEGAFYGCSGLTSITIPESVASIGDCAFGGCTGLTNIVNHSTTIQEISAGVFCNVGISAITLSISAEDEIAYRTADVWKDFNINVTQNSDNTDGVEIPNEPHVRIYPNPTNGMFTLEFEADGAYMITITDIIGMLVFRQTTAAQTVQINISNYPAGVYLLTINDGKRQNVTRIVKN